MVVSTGCFKRLVFAGLAVLLLSSCVAALDDLNDPQTRVKFQTMLQEGQRELAQAQSRLASMLTVARQNPAGTMAGLAQFSAEDILAPLNARLKIFEATLVLRRMDVDKGGNKGLVFALIPCYVERGDITVKSFADAIDCIVSGQTWPPKPLEMVAAVPLGANDQTIVNYKGGRGNLLEFMTNDPNQEEGFQTYFFGDTMFTAGYLAAALDKTGASALFNGDAATVALQMTRCLFEVDSGNPADEFFCRLGRIVSEVARGGLSLLDKVSNSMNM